MKYFKCSKGHVVAANDLTVHKKDWILEKISRFRCPYCHSATTWTEVKLAPMMEDEINKVTVTFSAIDCYSLFIIFGYAMAKGVCKLIPSSRIFRMKQALEDALISAKIID